MDKVIYYRGQAKNYSGNLKNGADIIPSIFRYKDREFSLIEEANYYIDTALSLQDVFNSKIDGDPELTAKILGKLQHRGVSTRLIDITKSYDIARYFASNKLFNDDGYIYHIIPEKSIKEIKDEYSLSVTRKIYTLMNSKTLIENNIDLVEYFTKLENVSNIKPYTIQNAVILDYEKLLKGRKIDNLRLNRQKGSFILLGNEIKENRLTGKINRSVFDDLDYPEIIKAKEKLNYLYELSLRGINYVNLFPDDDTAITLVSKYNQIFKLGKVNELMNFVDSKFKSSNHSKLTNFKNFILKNINDLYKEFNRDQNSFYFVFKELNDYYNFYYDIYNETNKVYELYNYEKIIKDLIKKSA
ncbi:MAG: FRG domain-containing protein [Bacilli bacterium]|nr:FRG domain-containing protein [Bacilli bacterium]